jgi:hypothetical protein
MQMQMQTQAPPNQYGMQMQGSPQHMMGQQQHHQHLPQMHQQQMMMQGGKGGKGHKGGGWDAVPPPAQTRMKTPGLVASAGVSILGLEKAMPSGTATETNISVGTRVQRGPMWTKGVCLNQNSPKPEFIFPPQPYPAVRPPVCLGLT